MTTTPAPPPRAGLPRALELALVLPTLLVCLPLVLGLALLIRLDSPGPVLFRQQRVGLGGQPFTLLKLRSMAFGSTGTAVTAHRDSRITRIGRTMRRFRLDELPQLWNVVRGDMALVGPRPEVPQFVDVEDSRWQLVLSVRPGLTDPTTLMFADEEERLGLLGGDPEHAYREILLPAKLASQVAWLEARNWRSDLRTLFATARVLIHS